MVLKTYDSLVDQDSLKSDKSQRLAAEQLQQLQYKLSQAQAKKLFFLPLKKRPAGIYLWGGVGRGKTMLMDMFYSGLPKGIGKKRVHFHEFMGSFHDYMHTARKNDTADRALLKYAREIVKQTPVLCFDEFHVTDIADAMILGRLFTALFDYGACIVMTSNWEPDKLYDGGLQRDRFEVFIKLLKEHIQIVYLDGSVDYRLQCLSDSGVYFSPLGDASARQFNTLFEKLVAGAPLVEETLSIKGHELHIPVTAKGVARLSFSLLCERPLGAQDYLALCRAYHTVFLEGIPTMDKDRRNEAKRFIILVDTLYDKGVKLIVTADAAADKLYTGKDHGFEFARTVSRLIEMQGTEYLASHQS